MSSKTKNKTRAPDGKNIGEGEKMYERRIGPYLEVMGSKKCGPVVALVSRRTASDEIRWWSNGYRSYESPYTRFILQEDVSPEGRFLGSFEDFLREEVAAEEVRQQLLWLRAERELRQKYNRLFEAGLYDLGSLIEWLEGFLEVLEKEPLEEASEDTPESVV